MKGTIINLIIVVGLVAFYIMGSGYLGIMGQKTDGDFEPNTLGWILVGLILMSGFALPVTIIRGIAGTRSLLSKDTIRFLGYFVAWFAFLIIGYFTGIIGQETETGKFKLNTLGWIAVIGTSLLSLALIGNLIPDIRARPHRKWLKKKYPTLSFQEAQKQEAQEQREAQERKARERQFIQEARNRLKQIQIQIQEVDQETKNQLAREKERLEQELRPLKEEEMAMEREEVDAFVESIEAAAKSMAQQREAQERWEREQERKEQRRQDWERDREQRNREWAERQEWERREQNHREWAEKQERDHREWAERQERERRNR